MGGHIRAGASGEQDDVCGRVSARECGSNVQKTAAMGQPPNNQIKRQQPIRFAAKNGTRLYPLTQQRPQGVPLAPWVGERSSSIREGRLQRTWQRQYSAVPSQLASLGRGRAASPRGCCRRQSNKSANNRPSALDSHATRRSMLQGPTVTWAKCRRCTPDSTCLQ